MKKDMKITDAIDYLNGTILANEKSLNNIILTKPKYFELKKYIGTFSTILIIGIIPTVTISLFMTDMFIKFMILSLSFTFFTSFLSTIDNSNGFMFNYINNSLNIDKYINLLDKKRKIENEILSDKAQIDVLNHLLKHNQTTI